MQEEQRISPLATIIAFVVVTIMIIVGVVLLMSTRPQPVEITINPPLPTATPLPSQTPAPLFVYVTGAVASPQTTVSVPSGSRVQEVINAAGGFSTNADLNRVNLAGIVRDGDQVHVPLIGEALNTVNATPSGGGIVYINSATQTELETLPGIGPATAQAIIAFRQEIGAFRSLDDLDLVPGIGVATLEDLAPLISFE